jgi:hypothetical protein
MKIKTLALSTVVLALFSVSGWAGDRMKTKITIYHAVNLGSTQLSPGEYTMTWTESGKVAEVTFAQGKNVIATVPAEVAQGPSGYRSPAVIIDSNVLTAVALPHTSLSFTSGNAATGK